MKCPACACEESKVIDSRPSEDGTSIRRRRECLECQKRFTTYEHIENIPIAVIKKDKSREAFEKEKLIRGMMNACYKRQVPMKDIEEAAASIEQALQNRLQNEVLSTEIGEMVMEKLGKIDQVAYVRFASVYREFKDVDNFMDELKTLLKQKKSGKTRE